MNFLKIKETCLYVSDLETAKKFYHELLGLPVIHYLAGKHLFMRVGASVLLLFDPEDSKTKVSPPPHYGGGRQHFAFEVSTHDYSSCRAWIESKGIEIIDEVSWTGATSFYFNDPEGNVLEVLPDRGVWD